MNTEKETADWADFQTADGKEKTKRKREENEEQHAEPELSAKNCEKLIKSNSKTDTRSNWIKSNGEN